MAFGFYCHTIRILFYAMLLRNIAIQLSFFSSLLFSLSIIFGHSLPNILGTRILLIPPLVISNCPVDWSSACASVAGWIPSSSPNSW